MANLTISVNDEVLKRARIRALEENCSVNAILSQYLEHYAQTDDLKRQRVQALNTLRELAEQGQYGRGSATWIRDDLHER